MFLRSLPCPVSGCRKRRRKSLFLCRLCFGHLPTHVREAIAGERRKCQLAGIEHSQELLRLRSDAIALLNREAHARRAQPMVEQLPLPA
jgi:hypothetical protein